MQLPRVYLIKTQRLPIFEQLLLEERLLRTSKDNFCIINEGSSPAIVLGISNKVEEHLSIKAPTISVIQRYSGGGSVVVDPNTIFISWIFNSDEIQISPFPKEILLWTKQFFCPIIPQFQIVCNDYAIGQKKFGGNAQYLAKGRFVHHSTLLWDYDPTLMNQLALPPKMPDWRKKRAHSDFLCALKSYLPCKESFVSDLNNTINKSFFVCECTLQEALKMGDFNARVGTKKVFF
jgi:lipoate-protein ligase A